MKLIRYISIILLVTGCIQKEVQPSSFQVDFTPSKNLEADFINPPDYAKPRAYWWWLEGKISKEGIVHDLNEMKRVGIQGAIIFDAGSSSYNGMEITEPGPVFMGEEWRELFTYACLVADSLDMEISLNIGSGWNDGGPWVTPEFTSKKLVWSEMTVEGPGVFKGTIPVPEGLLIDENSGEPYYQPIAALAVKLTENSENIPPLENMEIKAVHSIRIPKTSNGTGYDWDIFMKEEASPEGECNAFLKDVINISDYMDADGNITWDMPEGKFLLMRFGYTGTGIKVSTHSPGGGGLAIDYLSTEAMDLQYDHTAGILVNDLKKAGSKSLTFLHDDSWELGAANWTDHLEEKFREANGYDILSYLPVITGRIMESRDESNRFLYDFRRTIADLIWANHYKHFYERAHADGLGIHPESGGPHPAPIDALKNVGLNDIPMGEFWIRANTHRVTPENRLFVKQPASAAHIYGKRFVQAEGPTSIGPHWEEDFAYMKPTLDRVYCEGLNRLVIHTYTHSPKEAGIPGNEYFAGTHFNPNVTWWNQASEFLTWNARASFMLAQGLFVGDVCYYYGDNVPNQVPLKHIKEGLGEGYDYDICNTQVILERMSVKNGKITLPDGMSYEILVLPDRIGINTEVMEKIEMMIREGATVIGPKPHTSVGLRGNREAREKVHELADAVWGNDPAHTGVRSYGKGFIYTNVPERDVLSQKNVQPDFIYKSRKADALIDYIHRQTEEADIYYVVNRNERPEYLHTSYRVSNKIPEIWDPVTGSMVEQSIYANNGERTDLPLFLEPFGSAFIVFRKAAAPHYTNISWNDKSLFPELPTDTFTFDPFICQPDGKFVFTLSGNYKLNHSSGKNSTIISAEPESIPVDNSWQVSFDPEWGGPASTVFPELILWNEHDEPGIKYYSGTAEYTGTFELSGQPQKDKKIYLDLGEMYNLGEVYINDTPAGIWWQPPFIKDITGLVKAGKNDLRIKVVNLWPNRLIGDQFLPEKERYTRTNVNKFNKEYPLRPSGLAGPVYLRIYNYE